MSKPLSYREMAVKAIIASSRFGRGVSRQAVKKYISSTQGCSNVALRNALNTLVKSGAVEQVGQTFTITASGRELCTPKPKKKTAKKVAKKTTKKMIKKTIKKTIKKSTTEKPGRGKWSISESNAIKEFKLTKEDLESGVDSGALRAPCTGFYFGKEFLRYHRKEVEDYVRTLPTNEEEETDSEEETD